MSFNAKTEEYYKKFIELQEKLRKSEEERLKLEMKFNEMVQITREEEQMHYRRLRSQYKRFLEEDRRRQDRNERILRTLERIENRVAMLIAKTERFKLLRQQYQTFLDRTYKAKQLRRSAPPATLPKESQTESSRPGENKGDIVQNYLQNLSSQKLKDLLKKEEEARERLSEAADPDNRKKYDFYSFTESDLKPNYANSIADDIINSIYSRPKPSEALKSSKSREMNNNINFNQFKQIERPTPNYSSNVELRNYPNEFKEYDDKDRINVVKTRIEDSESDDLSESESYYKKEPISFKTHKLKDVVEKVKGDLRYQKLNKDLTQTPKEDMRYQKVNKGDEKTVDPLVQNKNETFSEVQPDVPNINLECDKIDNDKTTVQFDDETENKIKEIPNQREIEEVAIPEIIQENEALGEEKEKESIHEDETRDPECLEEKEFIEEITKDEDYDKEDASNKSPITHESLEELEEEKRDESKEETNKEEEAVDEKPEPSEIEQLGENVPSTVDNEMDQLSPQQYNEVEPIAIEEENPRPEEIFDTNIPLEQQPDESNKQVEYEQYQYEQSQYDENGQFIQQYDENGQPIPNQQFLQYDENGQPIQQYDAQFIQQYDESGQPIPQYDENGQLIQQYDDGSGQMFQQYDEQGQLIQQYGENGQFIQQYDENGQPYQQYDEQGQIVQQYDENGVSFQQQYYDDQAYGENVQREVENPEVQPTFAQPETTELQKEDDQNVTEPNAAQKPAVMDILDTDTESAKQDTKVSNDSDFDFSTNQ